MNEENNELNSVNTSVEPTTQIPVEPVSTIPETPTFEGPLTNTSLEEKPAKKSPIILIILLIVLLGAGGYFAYTKYFKKNTDVKPVNNTIVEPTEESQVEPVIEYNPVLPLKADTSKVLSEEEALKTGKSAYKKLQEFMDQFEKDAEAVSADTDYDEDGNEIKLNIDQNLCIDFDGKRSCESTDEMFVKHANFLSEFKTFFASDVKITDVFAKYDGKTGNQDDADYKYTCSFNNCDGYKNIAYVVDNNEYYFDSACRGSGCGRGGVTQFKVTTIEKDKLVFTYKVLWEKSIGDGMCDFKNKNEYNNYVNKQPTYTLELTAEDGYWKVSKGAFYDKCNNTQAIKQKNYKAYSFEG